MADRNRLLHQGGDTDGVEVDCYVFGRFITGQLDAGKPVPGQVLERFKHHQLMSVCGHESDCDAEEFGEELIGTAEVASILRCDPRHVRRLTKDLEGCRVNGRYVFRKSFVEKYEEARSQHRQGAVAQAQLHP